MRRIRWRSASLWIVLIALVCLTGAVRLVQGSDPSTWPIVYQDDFQTSESSWAVGETESVSRAYVNGNYEIQVNQPQSIAWSQIPGNRDFLDFSLETDVQVTEGSGEFGLIFRHVDSDNFYKFTISTDAHYQFVLREQGTYYTLLDGQVGTNGKAKSKTKRGDFCRLKVVAEGASFTFFLDGNFLAACSNSSLRSGQLGLCAETFNGPRVVVRFAHLELKAPLEQQPIEDRANLLYSKGSVLYKSNGYEAALAPLSDACQLFELLGRTKEFGQSAYLLADSLYNLARYQEALLQFQLAADAFLAVNIPQIAALSLSSCGNCFMDLGEYEESLHSFQQAHSLYQRVKDKYGVATTLLYSSMSYAGLGDYRAAIEAGEGSIDLYKTLGQQVEVALISDSLAVYYMLVGDLTMAQRYSVQALTLCNDLDDPPGMALACIVLGHIHLAAGARDLATEDFKQALSISSTAKDFPLDTRVMILQGLATCLLEQEPELARRCLELAKSIQEKLGDPRGEADSLSSLGDYWYALGDYEQAIQHYEASLAITTKIGEKVKRAMALGNLGNCYYNMADQQKAIDYYKQGIQLMEDATNSNYYTANAPEVLWRLYWGLGSSLHELGKLREASAEWVKAVDVIESMRALLARAEMMPLFMWDKFDVYWHLITSLFEMGDPERALSYAERAKARTLVDMMETAMLQQTSVVHDKLRPMAAVLRELNGLYDSSIASFSELMAGLPIQAGQGVAAERAQKDYIAIRTSLEREYPALGDTFSVEPTTLLSRFQYVQGKLGKGTVGLEYFVTDDETIVWVIAHDGIQTASKIAISKDDLTKQVRGFREEIESPPVPAQEAVSYLNALEKGRYLYELLIAPVEEYLKGATHLVIIPSDVLFYLPFGALVNCPDCEQRDLYGGKFLVENYPISYAPSLSSLYWPFQHARGDSYSSILAVGNPTRNLPASEEEVKKAAALFPQSTVLIGAQATEAAVKESLQTANYDVIHLSTHALFDTKMPLLSELVFREGGNDDGNLYAGEILGLSLKTNLVVLSACQTALPPELTEETEGLVVGDELQGLSQALFVAGAPTAALTLWNVNDVSTSYLMQTMYKGLMEGNSKGEALRQAQLSLLHNPTYRHPYYWVPFVLYGDWR